MSETLVWTFTQFTSQEGRSPYGDDYINAARRGVRRASRGRCMAEFITDDDVPPEVQGKGWWGNLWLFSPDAHVRFGNAGQGILYAGLDNVFIDRLDDLARHMLDRPEPILGMRDYCLGHWGNNPMRVKPGPQTAQIWHRFVNDRYPCRSRPQWGDQDYVRTAAIDLKIPLGFIDDHWSQDYKTSVTHENTEHPSRTRSQWRDAAMLHFFAKPKPHELRHVEIVQSYWGL